MNKTNLILKFSFYYFTFYAIYIWLLAGEFFRDFNIGIERFIERIMIQDIWFNLPYLNWSKQNGYYTNGLPFIEYYHYDYMFHLMVLTSIIIAMASYSLYRKYQKQFSFLKLIRYTSSIILLLPLGIFIFDYREFYIHFTNPLYSYIGWITNDLLLIFCVIGIIVPTIFISLNKYLYHMEELY